MSLVRKLVQSQIALSRQFDRLLPHKYRIDGNQDYLISFVPEYLQPGFKVYDVGGGKNPVISPMLKQKLSLTVIGLDIDKQELALAPAGAYNQIVCADILEYQGVQDADLVLCNAVLEHVQNVERALANIAGLLKLGGLVVIFVPSKNALYARLNVLLPERLKKFLLYAFFPKTRKNQGFKSYYDRCTPKDFERLGQRVGLTVQAKRVYFLSSYFSCCFPAYLLWRLWIIGFHRLYKDQAAETFSMALRKEEGKS